MKKMKMIFILFIAMNAFAAEVASKKKLIKFEGINFKEEFDSFYDPKKDYAHFWGRVTDKDDTTNILKIKAETKNVRFFKVGDTVTFKVGNNLDNEEHCRAYVRDNEKDFFVIYVEQIGICWKNDAYFRRGALLYFESPVIARRIRDASLYRAKLLNRRKDFYNQLNEVNHFVWSFDQQKVLTASQYDQKIMQLQQEKQRAMNSLVNKKSDYLKLQREIAYQLDIIDKDLDYYKVDQEELLVDRWDQDHDLGHPVGNRPQKPVNERKNQENIAPNLKHNPAPPF